MTTTTKSKYNPVPTLSDLFSALGATPDTPVHQLPDAAAQGLLHLVTHGVGQAQQKADGPQKFNLNTAVAQADQPYISALYSAAGENPNGTGQASAASSIPGLAEYLQNASPQEAATITQGLNAVAQAGAQMPAAIKDQSENAGNAGLLEDLLNAAKYQAIYKQANYAPSPPSNTPLGQLYAAVVAGGNSLSGDGSSSGLPTSTQTAPASSASAAKNPVQPNNPYSLSGP